MQFVVVSNCVKWSARCGQLHTLHTRAQVGCGLVATRRLLSIIIYRTREIIIAEETFYGDNYSVFLNVHKSVKSKPTVDASIPTYVYVERQRKATDLHTIIMVLHALYCTISHKLHKWVRIQWLFMLVICHTFCSRYILRGLKSSERTRSYINSRQDVVIQTIYII